MPALRDVLSLMEQWYPAGQADDWDAVGLVCGDPAQDVRRVLLAVDPVAAVAEQADDYDLLVVHHPLYLKGTTSVATTTPKGRVVHRLLAHGCALFSAHTNADAPAGGVSESLALALGVQGPRPLQPAPGDPDRGSGRIGVLAEPVTLRVFADRVAAVLPATAHGVRVAGDPDRTVRTVALCGGSGDFLLDAVRASDADVYLTSDLRHHPAGEFREHDGPALVDVAHWAAEWTWLPVLQRRLQSALGDTVEFDVSTLVTDPWTFRAATDLHRP